MMKSILRSSNVRRVDHNKIESEHKYTSNKLEGANLDNIVFSKSEFKHFLFSDCGMKKTIFEECVFKDCIFAGCYMNGAIFKDCKIIGCHFEICTTKNMKLTDTQIEHVDFFRCTFPYEELVKNLGKNYSSNDKMLLNCAAEAHRIGRWREAERFVERHMVEKRRQWARIIKNDNKLIHPPKILYRLQCAGRYALSLILKYTFGDRVSILRLILIFAFLVFLIGPTIILIFDEAKWKSLEYQHEFIQFIAAGFLFYKSYFLTFVNLIIGTNYNTPYAPEISHKETIEILSRIFGVVYLSICGNIITKSIGNSPY